MEERPEKGRKLWLMVELVIFAGIITGIVLINFTTVFLTAAQSIGYGFLAVGFFCIIAIEIYLALRSPRQ